MSKSARPPGVLVYLDIRPALQRLTKEQVGTLFLAILDFAESGVEPDFSDDLALDVSWAFIRPRIEEDMSNYEHKKSTNAEIARNAWARRRTAAEAEPKGTRLHTDAYERTQTDANAYQNNSTQNNSTQNNSDIILPPQAATTKQKRFVQPSVEEVQTFINDNGFSVDAHRFVDYYNAVGWKIGRSPMKDWKSTVKNWQRREPPNIRDSDYYKNVEGSL